jgi:hypothetical protein
MNVAVVPLEVPANAPFRYMPYETTPALGDGDQLTVMALAPVAVACRDAGGRGGPALPAPPPAQLVVVAVVRARADVTPLAVASTSNVYCVPHDSAEAV